MKVCNLVISCHLLFLGDGMLNLESSGEENDDLIIMWELSGIMSVVIEMYFGKYTSNISI